MSPEESYRSLYLGRPFRVMPEDEQLLTRTERGETLKNGFVSFNRGFGWYHFDELWVRGRGQRHHWGAWELHVTQLQHSGTTWQQNWWLQLYLDRLCRATLTDPVLHAGNVYIGIISMLIETPVSTRYRLTAEGSYGNHGLAWPEGLDKYNLIVHLHGPVRAVPR